MIRPATFIAVAIVVAQTQEVNAGRFIIVPYEDEIEVEPDVIPEPYDDQKQNLRDYLLVDRMKKSFEELGNVPDYFNEEKPIIYLTEAAMLNALTSLMPDDIAIYFANDLDPSEIVSWATLDNETWRNQLERFALANSINIALDWDSKFVQINKNKSRLDNNLNIRSKEIEDSAGNKFIIRSAEHDLKLRNQSGVLYLNGEAIRFREIQ